MWKLVLRFGYEHGLIDTKKFKVLYRDGTKAAKWT